MENNYVFDLNNFISPHLSYAPVYIWVWNDVCTREIIDLQLEEMQNLGIRAFYILPEPKDFRPNSMPTNLYPEYLSDAYFELCAYAIKRAHDLGMLCWIYDEGGWPSGGACGKVMKDHPEYGRQVLKVYERSFSAGDNYEKSSTDVIASFIQDKQMIPEGYVFPEDSWVTEYAAEKETGSYPDLLNKNATDYFIEITHKKYASACKEALGQNITAVFTDEPKAPVNAFNMELVKRYEALYGESLLPHLPLIAQRAEVTEHNVQILHRWYDICSHAFCENYLLPCKQWANDNGMAFTGHLDNDHDPLGCIAGRNFNLMRALRCLDIPGIDVIWRQLYPENKSTIKNDWNSYNGFYPRYASSAAAQNGSTFAMSEVFGVAGPGLTYDLMRYTVGYQAVRGINIFNLFNFSLGRRGVYLAQELPIYTQSQPYYQALKSFNRYMERLCYISSQGERICETALYYPVCDIQGRLHAKAMANAFDALGRALEDMTVDFDIVDDDVIQNASGTDAGYIRVGKAGYRHIIIPKGAYIPRKTQIMLDAFMKNGGKVSYDIAAAKPVIKVAGAGLRAMHRKAESYELFCLFRETGESGDYRIHLPSAKGYLLDLMDGKLQRIFAENNILNLSLAVGETAVLLLTDEELPSEATKVFKKKFVIADDFWIRKESELICNENGFETANHSDAAMPVRLGDWSALLGSGYSGSCVYETTFTIPHEMTEKECSLDLGDVHHTACVYLNGHLLGTVLMPPYQFNIPGGMLSKNNNLKIVVTNTSANWYAHTDYFDRWSIPELSPYFDGQQAYAKDVASGGLFGPVVLHWE